MASAKKKIKPANSRPGAGKPKARAKASKHATKPSAGKAVPRAWQSDVIVDLIKHYGFPFVTLNPGASFRGLHDSLVNYGGNEPQMMLCQHEEIAVQIAHGYAKATGQPAAVILHNLVGLLHACMAIYYAYIDRAPLFIMGATGPMHEGKRRPHIDWSHSALVQGTAIRDYVKWDYQPTAIEGVAESFARAFSVMTTEPKGPIYLCFDAGLQEAPLTVEAPLPPDKAAATPSRSLPDPKVLEAIAERLLAAKSPVILVQYAGRTAGNFEKLVALAETAALPVYDVNDALNFPNRHPLCLSPDKQIFRETDLVLGIDVRDWEKPTAELDSTNRVVKQLVPESADWLEIGFAEVGISKWSLDYGRMMPWSLRALGDPALAMPELTRLLRARIARDPKLSRRIEARRKDVAARHAQLHAKWREDAREDWNASPIALGRLAHEVWEAVKDEDWVLSAGTLRNWPRKLWNFDKPYRHPGDSLGTSTQIGISLGVALAHKGSGRIVVDLQPDGDLMFDAGSLWVAAKYQIPMLVVMFNNRAYFNDWEHQVRMARLRDTDEEKAHIGMDLFGPEPDFGALARSMGCWGEGPIEDPKDIRPALRRALAEVKRGRLALVDTVTRHR